MRGLETFDDRIYEMMTVNLEWKVFITSILYLDFRSVEVVWVVYSKNSSILYTVGEAERLGENLAQEQKQSHNGAFKSVCQHY